jgi:hypothetical protein
MRRSCASFILWKAASADGLNLSPERPGWRKWERLGAFSLSLEELPKTKFFSFSIYLIAESSCYGLYANAHRGKVRKAGHVPVALGMLEEDLPRVPSKGWAEMIRASRQSSRQLALAGEHVAQRGHSGGERDVRADGRRL